MWRLIDPKILILVGGTATQGVLDAKQGITKLRTIEHSYTNGYLKGKQIPTYALFHPSYLLRQPSNKRLAWRDMLQIRERAEILGVKF